MVDFITRDICMLPHMIHPNVHLHILHLPTTNNKVSSTLQLLGKMRPSWVRTMMPTPQGMVTNKLSDQLLPKI